MIIRLELRDAVALAREPMLAHPLQRADELERGGCHPPVSHEDRVVVPGLVEALERGTFSKRRGLQLPEGVNQVPKLSLMLLPGRVDWLGIGRRLSTDVGTRGWRIDDVFGRRRRLGVLRRRLRIASSRRGERCSEQEETPKAGAHGLTLSHSAGRAWHTVVQR